MCSLQLFLTSETRSGNTGTKRNFGYNDPDFLKEERACCNYNIEQNGVLMKVKKREHDTYKLRNAPHFASVKGEKVSNSNSQRNRTPAKTITVRSWYHDQFSCFCFLRKGNANIRFFKNSHTSIGSQFCLVALYWW